MKSLKNRTLGEVIKVLNEKLIIKSGSNYNLSEKLRGELTLKGLDTLQSPYL